MSKMEQKKLRNIYRFVWEHEFGDGFAPGRGTGVYVEGLELPFVLFRCRWPVIVDNERTGKSMVSCQDGTCDGVWGIVEWIDEPPESVKQEAAEMASMQRNLVI